VVRGYRGSLGTACHDVSKSLITRIEIAADPQTVTITQVSPITSTLHPQLSKSSQHTPTSSAPSSPTASSTTKL